MVWTIMRTNILLKKTGGGESIVYYNEVISIIRVVEASKEELAHCKNSKPNTQFQMLVF